MGGVSVERALQFSAKHMKRGANWWSSADAPAGGGWAMRRQMPRQPRDTVRMGYSVEAAYAIWWQGDDMLDLSIQAASAARCAWEDGDAHEQVQALGTYLCRGVDTYVSVRIEWNASAQRPQVCADVKTRPVRGPGGVTWTACESVAEAIEVARGEVCRLHRWLERWENLPQHEQDTIMARRLDRALALPRQARDPLTPEQQAQQVRLLHARIALCRRRSERIAHQRSNTRAAATTKVAAAYRNAVELDGLLNELRRYTP